MGNKCIYIKLVRLFTIILFPTFQLDWQGPTENSMNRARVILIVPDWKLSSVTHMLLKLMGAPPCKDINFTSKPIEDTSSLPKTSFDWLSCIRKTLTDQGVTGEAQDIMDSWQHSTRQQYSSYFAHIGWFLLLVVVHSGTLNQSNLLDVIKKETMCN